MTTEPMRGGLVLTGVLALEISSAEHQGSLMWSGVVWGPMQWFGVGRGPSMQMGRWKRLRGASAAHCVGPRKGEGSPTGAWKRSEWGSTGSGVVSMSVTSGSNVGSEVR